jgi:hypothetical protein
LVPAAVVVTPSPDDPVFETVFTTTLPPEALPSGDRLTAGLALFTIPVGAHSTWEPTCCPGPMVEYVVAGTYDVRAEAPMTVVRANGAVEEIAAGVDVALVAGDALISRNETVVEAWNDGPVPTLLLNWMVIDGAVGHLVPGWVSTQSDVQLRVTLPRAATTLTLLRITLPDGGEAMLEPAGGMQFGVLGGAYVAQNGYFTRRTDGSIRSIKASPGAPIVAYVLKAAPDAVAGAPPARADR